MNASVNYTDQNYRFAIIQAYKMKLKGLLFIGILLTVAESIHAQVKTDTVPVFLADSINTVYIYADTGTALNRKDSKGRKQGLWEKKYADGHLKYRGHFIDDKPYGVFKNYYDEGDSLEALRVYSGDGQSAYAHLFYTTGALQAEGKYVGEKKDSIWKFYDDLQRMVRKDQFKNGKQEGKSVSFYPADGNVLEIKNWKDDSADGNYQQYYDGGGIMEEGTYVHGERQDTLYIYDMAGIISIKGTYLNDMHEGNWIDYTDGVPVDTLMYHLGRCLNCYKYERTQKQLDSLKLHFQHLQDQLEHPSNDLEDGSQQPDGEE